MGILSLISPFAPIIDRLVALIPNPNDRARAKEEFQTSFMQIYAEQMQGQLEVNKAEAANANPFVSGWRPFIGWVCGFSLCYVYLIHPIMSAVLVLCGVDVVLPSLNSDVMMELTLGMLGMAGLRTFDKMKGTVK